MNNKHSEADEDVGFFLSDEFYSAIGYFGLGVFIFDITAFVLIALALHNV